MKATIIGILSAFFFSVTFVLNRAMELDGGSWIWSASLRFFFMLPLLLIIVGFKRNIMPVLLHIKKQPLPWIIWSTVGFGLFYAPLTFSTIYGPGWLVAATFQLTIISGSLLVPFLSKGKKQRIPMQSVFISLAILARRLSYSIGTRIICTDYECFTMCDSHNRFRICLPTWQS